MKPLRLPWAGRDVPNATLDILRTCNIRCRYCYNARSSFIKPLADILHELEELVRLRNLQAVSISGGEPLMHPELPAIIRAVRAKGLRCLLLTNGLLLDEAMAKTLAAAGADIVALHIQEGQERADLRDISSTDEVLALREQKAELLVKHGIIPGLSITIELDRPDITRRLLKGFTDSSHFEYMLVCLAWQGRPAATQPEALKILTKPERDCGRFAPLGLTEIFRQHGFLPLVWLPALNDLTLAQWIAYHSTQRRKHGTARGIRPLRISLLEKLSIPLMRALTGRYSFVMRTASWSSKLRLLVNAASGGGLCGLWFLMKTLLHGERIMDKHIVIELPPIPNPAGGFICCRDCPNATLRDGRLIAPCQADHPC